jgi:hypothetical protein
MAIKYKKWPQTTPNGHKIYQHFPFKGPPKIHPNWDFWYESKPSGNPGDLISIAVVNSTRINDKNIFEGMLQSLQAVPSFCIDLINQFLPPWMVRRCCRQLTASLPSLPSTYIQHSPFVVFYFHEWPMDSTSRPNPTKLDWKVTMGFSVETPGADFINIRFGRQFFGQIFTFTFWTNFHPKTTTHKFIRVLRTIILDVNIF